jgi:hypothetical protein
MSKIAEQKALEAYPPCINSNGFDLAEARREGYIKGYDKAMQDIFDYIEAHIPCGELSSGDVRGFINECKNYMQNESEN